MKINAHWLFHLINNNSELKDTDNKEKKMAHKLLLLLL